MDALLQRIKNWKILVSILSFFLVFIGILIATFFLHLFVDFRVEAAEDGQKLQVSQGGYALIEFSRPVNKASFSQCAVLEPNVAFTLSWQNVRILKLSFQNEVQVGQHFTLFSKCDIHDLLGNSLDKALHVEIEIVAQPQVVLTYPKGEAKTTDNMVIIFNRPMTVLTTLDEESTQIPPITLSPQMNGRWKWLGTTALEFQPEKPWSFSTEYSVSIAGTMQDLSGGKIGKETVFKFETPRPKIVKATIRSQLADSKEFVENDLQAYQFAFGKNPIRLNFNQAVDVQSVLNSISLIEVHDTLKSEKIEGNAMAFTLTQFQEAPKKDSKSEGVDLNAKLGNDKKNDEFSLLLSPQSTWQEGKKYHIEIKPEYKALGGDLSSKDKLFSADFSAAPKLEVSSVSPQNKTVLQTTFDATNTTLVTMNFSSPMKTTGLGKYITITPKLSNPPFNGTADESFYLENDERTYNGWWDMKPSTQYTITISKDIQDRFGRSLGKDYSWSFTTAPLAPQIALEIKGADFGVFESHMPPIYRMNATNIQKAYGAMAKLTLKDVIDIQKTRLSNPPENWFPDPKKYELLKEWDITPKGKLNEQIIQNLEVGKFFKDEDKQFTSGIYLIDVWSPEAKYSWNSQVIHNPHIFILTPYALTLKYSRDEAFVFASSLQDGKPVAQMNLHFFDFNGKEIAQGITDKQGMATVKVDAKKLHTAEAWNTDFVVQGEKDGEFTFIGSKWNDGLEPWKFGLSERWPSITDNPKQVIGTIVTDRPLYKPGETVYFKGIVRLFDQKKYTIPAQTPVVFKFYDNNYNQILEKNYKVSDFGGFQGELVIPKDAQYGNLRLEATIDIAGISDEWSKKVGTTIWVSHFQKAPFQVSVVTPKSEYIWGDSVNATIHAESFYGSPLSGEMAHIDISSSDYYFNHDDGGWYSFSSVGNWCYINCNGNNHFILSESKQLNAEGNADISFQIQSKNDESEPAKVSQVYSISASVTDSKTNQDVSGRAEIIAHYTDMYLGVKIDELLINAGDKATFKVISLHPDGTEKANTSFIATLIKRDYISVKRQGVDGDFYFENETKDTEIEKKNFSTDEHGKAQESLIIPSGGSFIIRVNARDENDREVLAETELWASSREVISWPRANNDRIDIIADKAEYSVGNNAKLLIKSPYSNVYALITKEQDSVIWKKLIKLESNAQSIEVPITENDIPNVYVSVVILKGRTSNGEYDKETKRDLGQPEFKVGYIKLPVNTKEKRLNVVVKSDKAQYLPQENVKLDIDVSDYTKKGARADLSVAVVDMSLLALTGYEKPNLFTIFYTELGLGVKTSLTMAKFIERFRPGGKGGGGGDKKSRGEFKNTAYWLGSLVTDANGHATTSFKLPDNLTTWKITVVAQDQKHRFGSGDSEMLESKRIVIDPSLPQFLTVNDEVEIPVAVVNREKKDLNTTVSLKIDGKNSKILGNTKEQILLKPGERGQVLFKVKAGNPGVLKLEFSALAGDIQDVLLEERRIQEFVTRETVSLSGKTEGQTREALFLPNNIASNQGGVDITLSSSLAYLLPKNLELLRTYPYECSEQSISKIFPNALVLKNPQLSKIFSDNEKKEVENELSAGLEKIYKDQSTGGSWGYFDTSNQDQRIYLTSYVLIALEEMKKSGVLIDEKVLLKARQYLQEQKNHPDINIEGFTRFALSYSDKTGTNAEYAKRRLAEVKKIAAFTRVYWAIASGDASLLQPILQSAFQTDRGVFVDESEDYGFYWGTSKRTTALLLFALEKLQSDHPYIPKIIQWLNLNKTSGGFGNTQENVWTLLSLIRHIEKEKLGSTNFTWKMQLAGKQETGAFQKDPFHIEKRSFSLDTFNRGEQYYLDLSKQGVGGLSYDAVMSYAVSAENVKARDEGFSLLREYYSLDGKKLTSTPKAGEMFKVKLTIVNPAEGNYVAVEDILPAGWLPINTQFATSDQNLEQNLNQPKQGEWQSLALWYFNHQEFRDDRVFLFAETLPAGVYEYEYAVKVSHSGTFSHQPARVFEMYNEDRFGRTAGERVVITH